MKTLIEQVSRELGAFERHPEDGDLFGRLVQRMQELKRLFLLVWDNAFMISDALRAEESPAEPHERQFSLLNRITPLEAYQKGVAECEQTWGRLLTRRYHLVSSAEKTETLRAIAEAGCGSRDMPAGLWCEEVGDVDRQVPLESGFKTLWIHPDRKGNLLLLGGNAGCLRKYAPRGETIWSIPLDQAVPDDAIVLMESHLPGGVAVLFGRSGRCAVIGEDGRTAARIKLPFSSVCDGFFDPSTDHYHLQDWDNKTYVIFDRQWRPLKPYAPPGGIHGKETLIRACPDFRRDRIVALLTPAYGSKVAPLTLGEYDREGNFRTALARIPFTDHGASMAVGAGGMIHIAFKRSPMCHLDPAGVQLPGPAIPPAFGLVARGRRLWLIDRQTFKPRALDWYMGDPSSAAEAHHPGTKGSAPDA